MIWTKRSAATFSLDISSPEDAWNMEDAGDFGGGQPGNPSESANPGAAPAAPVKSGDK